MKKNFLILFFTITLFYSCKKERAQSAAAPSIAGSKCIPQVSWVNGARFTTYFDSSGRITKYLQINSFGDTMKELLITCNGAGQIQEIYSPYNVTRTDYQYDASGRMIEAKTYESGALYFDYKYSYNSSGQISEMDDEYEKDKFTYDSRGNVIEVDIYDPLYNYITSKAYFDYDNAMNMYNKFNFESEIDWQNKYYAWGPNNVTKVYIGTYQNGHVTNDKVIEDQISYKYNSSDYPSFRLDSNIFGPTDFTLSNIDSVRYHCK